MHADRTAPEQSPIPRLDLRASPASGRVAAGEEVRLAWSVKDADHVWLYELPTSVSIQPVDWTLIERVGTKVDLEGAAAFHPQANTTYGIAATASRGWRIRAIFVDVQRDPPSRSAPATWHGDWQTLRPVHRRRMIDDRTRSRIECLWRAPTITFTARPLALFTDEEATLRWTTGCARCADLSDSFSHVGAVADPGVRSGTRVPFTDGSGSDALACSLDLFGESAATALYGPGDYTWSLNADGISGLSSTASAAVGFLPHPLFEGGDADRHAAIASALTLLYSALSRGCIRDDDGLDAAIAAFRDGHIVRHEFWARLRAEMQNLDLITFRCNDRLDDAWRGGSWTEFGNTIDLDWSPNHAPDLPFVVTHELIHKCGFHGDLAAFYPLEQIEIQAMQLTMACGF